VIDLKNQHHFGAELVRHVSIRTFRAATRLYQQIPRNTEEAQYNIKFPVAAAIVAGEVGPHQVLEAGFTDPLVIDLMNKITLCEDDDFEKQFPQKRYCEVQVELHSGVILESGPYQPFGEASDAIDLDWIEKKFHRITRQVISTSQAKQLINLLTMSYESSKISQIFDVLGKGA
jgi:2-methylcitrate dehydratase PrpD